MAESSEGFQSHGKDAAFDAGVPGGGTPKIVEGSLVLPAGHTQLVPQRESGQGRNWFNHEMPYAELVGNIRTLVDRERRKVAQAQAEFPDSPFTQKDPFNAAEWLGLQVRKQAMRAGDRDEREWSQFHQIQTAWDALAYTRYSDHESHGGWREWVKMELENHVEETHQTSFVLPPKSVKLLDAMAEVAGIPRTRGEATIDLTPFAPHNTDQQP